MAVYFDDGRVGDHREGDDVESNPQTHCGNGHFQPVFADDAGGNEDGAADRRSDRRQQRKPEHENVGKQQIDAEAVERRARDGYADDIGGGGRNFHAQQQAGQSGTETGGPQAVLGERQDYGRNLDAKAGHAQNADHNRSADDNGGDHGYLPAGQNRRFGPPPQKAARPQFEPYVHEQQQTP